MNGNEELTDLASRVLSDAHAIREGAKYVQDEDVSEPRLQFPPELVDTIRESGELIARPPYVVFRLDFARLDEEQYNLTPKALRSLPDELSFPEGISLITGPNGSGKSTLLKALNIALLGTDKLKDRDYLSLGPALKMREALTVEKIEGPDENVLLIDGATNWKDHKFDDWMLTLGSPYKRLSQRQARDERWEDIVEKTGARETTVLLLIDEPEMGLSPDRLAELHTQIKNMAGDGSAIIVATNSEHLIQGPYPRIDLIQPEKGLVYPNKR